MADRPITTTLPVIPDVDLTTTDTGALSTAIFNSMTAIGERQDLIERWNAYHQTLLDTVGDVLINPGGIIRQGITLTDAVSLLITPANYAGGTVADPDEMIAMPNVFTDIDVVIPFHTEGRIPPASRQLDHTVSHRLVIASDPNNGTNRRFFNISYGNEGSTNTYQLRFDFSGAGEGTDLAFLRTNPSTNENSFAIPDAPDSSYEIFVADLYYEALGSNTYRVRLNWIWLQELPESPSALFDLLDNYTRNNGGTHTTTTQTVRQGGNQMNLSTFGDAAMYEIRSGEGNFGAIALEHYTIGRSRRSNLLNLQQY